MVIRSARPTDILQTSDEVIDALGGTTAAAKLVGKLPQSINNSRRSGRLPADTFLIFSEALKARSKRAPTSLWGIRASRTVAYAGDV